MTNDRTVDFGRTKIPESEKTRRVSDVFSTVAERYDIMNDVMSLGTHRLLKRVFCDSTGIRRGYQVLDVAGGTGDIAKLLADVVRPTGNIVVLDVNESMVNVGRDRLINAGRAEVQFVVGEAESIPLPDVSFDAITMAFGLRNMTDKEQVLKECHRVLKPGGRLSILEFSKPKSRRLSRAFDTYQRFWPIAGHFIAGSSGPYRYLVESIEQHPTQEALLMLLEVAGFKNLKFENLFGGIVAIHQASR